MTKLSQFIVKHNVEDGYSIASTIERLAKFLRCSEDEILSGALDDDKVAQYLLDLSQRLAKETA